MECLKKLRKTLRDIIPEPRQMKLIETYNVDLGTDYEGKEKMRELAKELDSILSNSAIGKTGLIQYGDRSVIVRDEEKGFYTHVVFLGPFAEITNNGPFYRGWRQGIFDTIIETVNKKAVKNA